MVGQNRKKSLTTRRQQGGRYKVAIQPRLGFAISQEVRLRYVETIALNPSAGVIHDYIFSANSMYDPNITGTGHQPLGYDNWMTLYDHYCVTKSNIRVDVHSDNDTNVDTSSGFVGIQLSDSTVSMTGNSLDYVLEQGRSRYKLVGQANSNAACITIRNNCDIKKFFNRSSLKDCSELRGSTSTHPAEQALYHIWFGPIGGAHDVDQTYVTVTIDYTAVLTEPKLLAQS